VTVKFSLSVARRAFYDLLRDLVADYQPAVQQAMLGPMWKDEFKFLNLTDSPTAWSEDEFLKSGTEDTAWDTPDLSFDLPRCRVSGTFDGSYAPGSDHVVPWATQVYDTDGMWPGSSGNSYIEIQTDGVYIIVWNGEFSCAANDGMGTFTTEQSWVKLLDSSGNIMAADIETATGLTSPLTSFFHASHIQHVTDLEAGDEIHFSWGYGNNDALATGALERFSASVCMLVPT
jgi:hypothetical protein